MNAPQPALKVLTMPVGPLQCNCTILGNPLSKEALVIDPGGDPEWILGVVAREGWQVKQILHTHAHFDHFMASGQIKEATGAALALHKADQFLWEALEMQCRAFGMPYAPVPPPDRWIEHEEELVLDQIRGQALHTPGHTPGSTCFCFPSQKLLIAGDTLFQGSVGRTDLWGGDFRQLETSIKNRLYILDEATEVITGHGPKTSIGRELRSNPYVRA